MSDLLSGIPLLERGHATALRDSGMQAAAEHADRVVPDWQEIAYRAFCQHAREHATFTTEDVRRAAFEVPEPPDPRSWGAVAKRAITGGVVVKNGYVEAKNPAGHCRIVALFRRA